MSATCSLSDPADGKVPLRLVLNHPAIWPARKGFTEISGKAARAWGIKLPKEKTMRAMVAAIQAEKKQILERGRQEGRQEGLNQGLERGRSELIVRLADQKFGEGVGDRLAALLADRTDSGRVDHITRAILDCDTTDELFAKLLA